jgi:excisionase family DNA binding protein
MINNNPATTADKKALEASNRGAIVPFVLTKLQAANYLQVSERTIDNRRSEGVLPSCKIGGYVRFRRTDLDNYLLANNSHRKVLAA